MKKFIIALVGLSLIAAPAMADHRDGRYEQRQTQRDNGCGWLCGAIIGGVVVGAIASNSRNRVPNNQSYNYRQPDLVCQNEYVRDYDGNYILDQYGRVIFNQRCWYQ